MSACRNHLDRASSCTRREGNRSICGGHAVPPRPLYFLTACELHALGHGKRARCRHNRRKKHSHTRVGRCGHSGKLRHATNGARAANALRRNIFHSRSSLCFVLLLRHSLRASEGKGGTGMLSKALYLERRNEDNKRPASCLVKASTETNMANFS